MGANELEAAGAFLLLLGIFSLLYVVISKVIDIGEKKQNKCRDCGREFGDGEKRFRLHDKILCEECVKKLIHEKFPGAQIEIHKFRGLCSFYAEKGGILVGFEKA